MSGKTKAYEHLRFDTAHQFIELIPGERFEPIAGTSFYPDDWIKILVRGNPKRPGSKAHEAFALYKDGMTVDAFVRAFGAASFLAAFEERPGHSGPTTGKRRALMPGVERHTYWGGRVRAIVSAHVNDLGGFDACSEAEKSILRRASVITIECERLERRFASYPHDHIARNDIDVYIRLSNTLRHLLDLTGLERRTKSITPTIDQYIADHRDDPEPEPTMDIPDPATMREAAE